MTSSLRIAAVFLGAALGLAACARSESRPVRHTPPPAAPPAASKAAADNAATKGLGLGGQDTLITMPDHQHPQWPACKLLLKTFVSTLVNDSTTGHGATAILFTKGQRSAVMTAPTATGNSATNMVTASDGVHLASTDPAGHPTGRYLNADIVQWNSKTQLGKAYGHVHYGDTKNGMVGTTPILYFNSGLKKMSSTPLPPGS